MIPPLRHLNIGRPYTNIGILTACLKGRLLKFNQRVANGLNQLDAIIRSNLPIPQLESITRMILRRPRCFIFSFSRLISIFPLIWQPCVWRDKQDTIGISSVLWALILARDSEPVYNSASNYT